MATHDFTFFRSRVLCTRVDTIDISASSFVKNFDERTYKFYSRSMQKEKEKRFVLSIINVQ